MVVARCQRDRDGNRERKKESRAREVNRLRALLDSSTLHAAICLLAIGFCAATTPAQRVGGGGTAGGGTGLGRAGNGPAPPSTSSTGTANSTGYGTGTTGSQLETLEPDMDSNFPGWNDNIGNTPPAFDPILKEETCLRWTVAGVQGATVSAARLGVPKEAKKDFDGACSALKDKKLFQAEKQVRKAIEEYPDFVTAWVMLGQILDEQRQAPQAREACSHALSADANYVPAYLCMADLTYVEEDWDVLLDYSTRALALDPIHDAYGYFYSAAALYNKGDLARAEDDASRATVIDTQHREPEMVFLLAKIHQAQGDLSAAAAELREFLKLAPNSKDSELAKKDLASLDGSVKR